MVGSKKTNIGMNGTNMYTRNCMPDSRHTHHLKLQGRIYYMDFIVLNSNRMK